MVDPNISTTHQLIGYSKIKDDNNATQQMLVYASQYNSVGMIILGILTVFVAIPDINGQPWGYFGEIASLVFVTQLTSFIEIILFP